MEPNVWTTRELSAFIDIYQKESVLYNIKDELYHNKSARREGLERVIRGMSKIRPGITEAEVKSKWNSLRTQFAKEVQIMRSVPSGSGQTTKPKLWCFEKLLFLQDFVKGRKGICNVSASQSTPLEVTSDELSIPMPSTSQGVLLEEGSNEQEGNSAIFEISNDNAPPSTSTPRSLPGNTTKKRKRQRSENDPDETAALFHSIRESIENMNGPDRNLPETEIFGSFIASEMRLFRSAALQKRCKKEILRVLMHFQDLDEEQ